MSSPRFRTIILSITLFLIAVIPVVSFILSKNFRTASSAHAPSAPYSAPVTKIASNSAKLASADQGVGLGTATPEPSPTSEPSVNFGPTLSFTAFLDGRPSGKEATQMFIGIAQGSPTTNPTYLLTFTLDMPDTGKYSGLSIAGLNVGSTYTAYLKGKTQIATASAFLMSPAETQLNNGNPLTLLTGDLNQDNVINEADVAILNKALGTTASSANWNPDADFNLDGVVNSRDYAIMGKNLNRTGTSGPWISTPSTASASLTQPPSVGGESPTPGGYWMWVPK